MASRQLAAIMFTDIVGYTSLMGEDDAKAMQLLRKNRGLHKSIIKVHRGKWLKEMGDGTLASFKTTSDAVYCAGELQIAAKENEIQLRIGIHQGEVTEENGDIFGDGVNVASRIEPLAAPGQILVSGPVQQNIKNRPGISSTFIEEAELKHVDEPVKIYRLTIDGTEQHGLNRKEPFWFKKKVKIIASILIATLAISYGLINYWPITNTTTPTDIEKSIAVLPFENRSNLKDDEFFTDGVHDDLLTQISKIREIKTISRTSVKEYRNTTKNMRIIGEELGVGTILEGGVQRAGNQIRINVQLIDAKTDAHLWAETYTRELSAENIFTIQSEIAQAIATALATVLSPEEKQDIEKLPTQNLAALEAYFHAKVSSSKNTNQSYREAVDHLTRAIQLDTTFAIAYAELGIITLNTFWYEGLPMAEQIAKGKPLIEKAMKLDSTSSEVQGAFGYLKGYEQDSKSQELAYQKALELNPNNAWVNASYGDLSLHLGNKTKGFELLFKAKELDPLDDQLAMRLANQLSRFGRYDEARQIAQEIIARKPNNTLAYGTLAGIAYYYDHRLAECLRLQVRSARLSPGYPFGVFMTGLNCIQLGEKERAIAWFNHALSISPDFVGAILAQGFIYELSGEYNKALEHFLNTTQNFPPDHWVFQEVMLRVMELGLKTKRIPEAIDHYNNVIPALFQSDVRIDKSNFIPAYALGILLKVKGENEQAEHLFKESLKISQLKILQGPGSPENNWECRIHLAMGNHKAAISSFVKLVAEGIHTDEIVSNPVYQPLYDYPDFQKSMEIMKKRLEEERAMVKEMEANGELDIPPIPNK